MSFKAGAEGSRRVPVRILGPMLLAALISLPLFSAPPTEAASSPRITFYFGLKRPEAKARAAWNAVSDPAATRYREFVSPARIRARYGAGKKTRRTLRKIMRRRGLKVRYDRAGVFVRVSGPVRRMQRVFRVKVVRDDSDDPPLLGWVAKRRPKPPRAMRRLVRESVPMFNRSRQRQKPGRSARSQPLFSAAVPPANDGTWGTGCQAAKATGGYSFDQVRTAYGIDSLGRGGRASVAILNAGEGLTRANIRRAATCFGLPDLKPKTLLTDGQTHPFGLASFEAPLDLAMVRGMAPMIRKVAFAQVWETPQLWFLGPSRVFAMSRPPDVLSVSYGECETQVLGPRADRATRAGARLFDSLVVRLGLAGTGTYASAGDTGSSCGGQPRPGAIWPAASPFVTAVGGSRLVLDAANQRVDEVTWNDLPWLGPENGGGAGGGGFSRFRPRLGFQSGLGIPGRRRMIPDVSGHASALPGWPANLSTNWTAMAGTSASAPLIATAMALVGARERAAGRPAIGSANGLFYWLGERETPPYFDVTAGNNGFVKRVAPRYAQPGFDLATGLGVPRFDRIPALLPGSASG